MVDLVVNVYSFLIVGAMV